MHAMMRVESALQAVGSHLQKGPVVRRTAPVRGVGHRSTPFVLGLLREFAKGHRSVNHTIRCMRRDDALRRDTLLHPILHGAERIERAGSGSAGAMEHSRHHEESRLSLEFLVSSALPGEVLIK